MHPLCLILATLSLATPLPFGHMGPELPPIVGLRRPLPMAVSVADYSLACLRDLAGGAVVVVEDDFLPIPKMNVPNDYKMVGGRLRLQTGNLGQGIYGQPTYSWMDSNAVRSGGNVVSRIYPMGRGF